MTRGRMVSRAEMTGAEVTGAAETGAEMILDRSFYGPKWFGAELSLNQSDIGTVSGGMM